MYRERCSRDKGTGTRYALLAVMVTVIDRKEAIKIISKQKMYISRLSRTYYAADIINVFPGLVSFQDQ